MHITVSPPNPLWPQAFNTVASSLRALLAPLPLLSIEHVGSTSVPGLAAKPVLDIDIVIASDTAASVLPAIIAALTRPNHPDTHQDQDHNQDQDQAADSDPKSEYVYQGERGIAGRHAFQYTGANIVRIKPGLDGSGESTDAVEVAVEVGRNVYVCIAGTLGLRNHMVVREVLRRDAELRAAYAAVKTQLAARDVADIEEYVQGKNEVLGRILRAGGVEEEVLGVIEDANTFR